MKARRFSNFGLVGLAASALANASPTHAREGALHALYVGVADYLHGTPEGALRDLEGAPNDIATIRQALEAKVSFDSVTVLRDADAGRASILAALDAFAAGEKGVVGETLVFYYTGHGARAVDMAGTQASSFHSTLVPWDARSPEGLRRFESGDILDVELRERFDAITARGINVVTIFDSCNSGTATRNVGRSKSAPEIALKAARSPQQAVPPSAAIVPGYRVHLAAAVDNSEAFENRDSAGAWRSDFTVALAQAIGKARAGASYREIFEVAQAGIDALAKGQRPRTEGAVMTPFLAPRRKTDRLFTVDADGATGRLSLQGGTLALVDPGAVFALFDSVAEANAPGAKPRAVAKVATAGVATSTLDVTLPGSRRNLIARELASAPSSAKLEFAVDAEGTLSPETRALIERRANLFASAQGDYRIVSAAGSSSDVQIVSKDGSVVGAVAPGGALADALDRIARHDALLGKVGSGEGLDVKPSFVETRCDGSDPLTFSHEGETAKVAVGQPLRISATNPLPNDPLFLYLLYLGPDFSISLIDPAPYSEPIAWPAGACAAWKIAPDRKGRHMLLLIGSTQPLPGTSTLEQAGIADAQPDRTQAATAQGTRSTSAWAVRALTIVVD